MLKALNIKKNIENICFRITILLIHRTAETLGLKSVTWQHTSNITTDTVINYGPLGSFHSQAGEHKVWGGGCDNIVLTTTIITHHFCLTGSDHLSIDWFWPASICVLTMTTNIHKVYEAAVKTWDVRQPNTAMLGQLISRWTTVGRVWDLPGLHLPVLPV